MKTKKLLDRLKAPCSKCPYKLGLVNTVVNPCPQCKLNGYQAFEQFLREVPTRYPSSSKKDYENDKKSVR